MSYEGYTQYLCSNGHTWKLDAGEFLEPSSIKFNCPKCGAKPTHYADVDETNGFVEDDPSTFDAPLTVIRQEDEWHTDHYGNRYAIRIPIHGVPANSRWRTYPE